MYSFGYKPIDIANWFLNNIDRDAGDLISHLKLQKLLYYSQAWALVFLKKPLFDEEFYAWAHGPVEKSVYNKFRGMGSDEIEAPKRISTHIEKDEEELLKEVLRVYGEKSASTLRWLTHNEDPWKIARGDLSPEERCDNIITKESMEIYYSSLLKNA